MSVGGFNPISAAGIFTAPALRRMRREDEQLQIAANFTNQIDPSGHILSAVLTATALICPMETHDRNPFLLGTLL